jgi:hypothetical protein
MKPNLLPVAWICAALVAVSAILCSFLAYENIMLHRDMQRNGDRINQGAQLQQFTQNFVNDLIAYHKKQPGIAPILVKYGIATPAPAGTKVPAPQQPPQAKGENHGK